METHDHVDVFESDAVNLLVELGALGFTWTVASHGTKLRISPRDRLTPALAARISALRDVLLWWAKLGDDGVFERQEAFARQWAARRTDRLPAFVFREGLPYVEGACFSCGDELPDSTYGRCWRCALAWRLVVTVDIDPPTALALDTAKVA